MNEMRTNRGATVRLFGVVLLFLGMLDSLLAWRGGYGPGNFPAALLASGIFLYALGAILKISTVDVGVDTSQQSRRSSRQQRQSGHVVSDLAGKVKHP